MQQQQDMDRMKMKDGFNLAYYFADGCATCVTPFTRTNFGPEGFGVSSLCSPFLIIACGSAMNAIEMWYYLFAWFIAVVYQRMKTFSNRRKGLHCHRFYNGYPWLAYKFFPRVSEANAKAIEAFGCLTLGLVLMYFEIKGLGMFLIAGFLSIMFVEGIKAGLVRKRVQMMRDAQYEQQYLAEEFKRSHQGF